jgi:hypothetical protein
MPIPEFKRQPPVSTNPNRPTALLPAPQRMKPKARDVHVIDDLRRVERYQLYPQPLCMMRLNAGLGPRLIELA